jgi:hypothetical protein
VNTQDTTQTVGTPRARAMFESRGFTTEQQTTLVEEIKDLAATLYDKIDSVTNVNQTEASRLVALAKTSLEETVMWATKAVSRCNPSPNL